MSEREEHGTWYEAGRAPVQLRAVASVVLEILALLPDSEQSKVTERAKARLADDPGALRVLDAGLRIDYSKRPAP